MQVVNVSIGSVIPYEKNPRINAGAIEPVMKSLKEFGFQQPIVVDGNNVIVVGHTRFAAAKKLGLKEVPVVIAKDLTPEQVQAYRIADNKTSEFAGWDNDLLSKELQELQDTGFDFTVLEFSDKELEQLMGFDNSVPQEEVPAQIVSVAHSTQTVSVSTGEEPEEEPEEEDETIPVPKVPPIPKGELWRLGNHRLICGDAGNADEVAKLMGNAMAQLICTGPPYLTERPSTESQTSSMTVVMTDEERLVILDQWFANLARYLEPGRAIYCHGGYTNFAGYPAIWKKNDLRWSQCIVWDKGATPLRKDFMQCFELFFYGWKEGAGHKYFGKMSEHNIWKIAKPPKNERIHPRQLPNELLAKMITLSSLPGENVMDLFGGGGSTLYACEQTGRNCYIMELDGSFCALMIKRWEEITGEKAERLG